MTPEATVIEALFFIQSKTGEKVPFKLNGDQVKYDEERTIRDIIPKARQRGFSSLGIAYQTVDCLGKEGTRAVLISHEAKATQRLLDKAAYYLKHLRGADPELGRHSRNEFYFPKTESTFYIGTAGAKAFGRGDTITHLHISEYAWWESDALKQVAGLFQAVPKGGTIRIESTGNGRANDFYYMVENAERLGYHINFAPWWDNDEYRMAAPQGWVPEGFENYFTDMQHQYNLSDDQLYWYWIKLLEFRLDLRYMQQEYPSRLEECFQATGGAVFPDVTRVKSDYWQWRLDKRDDVKTGLRVEYNTQHPRKRRTYVIGADPSGGTGHDDAAIQVVCMETLEQVLEFGHNEIDPVTFGRIICDIGKAFDEAFIVCEGNHHGIATHAIIRKNYNTQKIYKRFLPTKAGTVKYGFMTTNNSKAELVGCIKECINNGLAIFGEKTIQAMIKFEETETGTMEGPKDDYVIALGLACVGVLKYKRYGYIVLEEPPAKPKPEWMDPNWRYTPTFEEMLQTIDDRNKDKSLFGY